MLVSACGSAPQGWAAVYGGMGQGAARGTQTVQKESVMKRWVRFVVIKKGLVCGKCCAAGHH